MLSKLKNGNYCQKYLNKFITFLISKYHESFQSFLL